MYPAPPIDQNRADAKNAPTDPIRFLDGTVADNPALTSPETKDTMLRSVKSANAIRTTPITSRLMCEEGEAAPRASPRLAEVDAPIERMLAQGMGHFKQEEGMEPDDLLCSRNARSRTPLVGRAQWKINQAPSLRENKRAWRDHLYGW
jgi:hypothetical protein